MNPNSQNQLWSRWTFRVYPGNSSIHEFKEVRNSCAVFAHKGFGSAGQMNVEWKYDKEARSMYWLVDIRVEGFDANDPGKCKYMIDSWRTFFGRTFGDKTRIKHELRIEAGYKQDGKPPDQLLIIPPLRLM